MNKFSFIFMIALLVSSSVAMARDSVDEIDLEVVALLSLNDEQAVAYSAIMRQQRYVFRTDQPRGWAQQKAFYQDTFARVRTVLSEQQYIRFVGYMDSFLEAIPDEDLLAME